MTKTTEMWHKPPVIAPNYGRKKSFMPKSNVPQVLLHDNVTQKQMLAARLSHIRTEHNRAQRVLELHRKAFLSKQVMREQQHLSFSRSHPGCHSAVNSKSLSGLEQLIQKENNPRAKSSPLLLKRAHTSFVLHHKSSEDLIESHRKSNSFVSPQETVVSKGQPEPPSSGRLPTIHRDPGSRAKSSYLPGSKLNSFTTYDYHLKRETTFAFGESSKEQGSRPVSKTGRTVTLNDPRFLGLQSSLCRPDRPIDGFIQLSPSGHGVLERYGVPLYDYEALRRSLEEYSAVVPEDKSSKSSSSGNGV